jgi:hypothetical protein
VSEAAPSVFTGALIDGLATGTPTSTATGWSTSTSSENPLEPPIKAPEFGRVGRITWGFDPRAVHEFLGQFALNPRLDIPDFPLARDGYAKREVREHIRSLQVRALQGELS